jgi:hypothetical protein
MAEYKEDFDGPVADMINDDVDRALTWAEAHLAPHDVVGLHALVVAAMGTPNLVASAEFLALIDHVVTNRAPIEVVATAAVVANNYAPVYAPPDLLQSFRRHGMVSLGLAPDLLENVVVGFDPAAVVAIPAADAVHITSALNGFLEDIAPTLQRGYIPEGYFLTESDVKQVTYSMQMGVPPEKSYLLAVMRKFMGIYDVFVHADAAEKVVIAEIDRDAVVGYITWVRANPGLLRSLKAAAVGLLVLIGIQVAKSGHHFLSSTPGGFRALLEYCGLNWADLDTDIICHASAHPLSVDQTWDLLTRNPLYGVRPAFAAEVEFKWDDVPDLVKLRAQPMPTGYAWLGALESLVTTIRAMPFGPYVVDMFRASFVTITAYAAELRRAPRTYSVGWGGGGRAHGDLFTTPLHPARVAVGTDPATIHAAVPMILGWKAAYIRDERHSINRSKSLAKREAMVAAEIAVWKDAFRAYREDNDNDLMAMLGVDVAPPAPAPADPTMIAIVEMALRRG